jgi:imidazolonepropionase-like amidohydrolase
VTPPSAATLLRNLRIWDGTRVLPADCLRLHGRRIEAVGDGLRPHPTDRVIDCAGATAIPGLIDAHVHLELDPEQSQPPQLSDVRDAARLDARAGAMVRAGITTARDLGGGAWAEFALRDRIRSGLVAGPRLLCAGQPITTLSGHCHFWGGAAADLAEALRVLERQVAHGADLIKVMATGGMFTRGSDPAGAQFDLPTLQGIVTAADRHGLPVAAHCHGTRGIELAARAGVRTIEHCSWMGANGWAGNYEDAVARLMLDRGVWVSPTVNRGWRRYLDNPDPTKLLRIRSAFTAMSTMGIDFVASTDAGIPGVFHHHLPEALAVFSRIAEFSPEATLRSATSDAARALGLDAVTGQLAAGLDADVVLLDGDPLADLTALTRPVGIWAAGRVCLLP